MKGDVIKYAGRTFTRADIKSGKVSLARALMSDVLEIDILKFTVKSHDATLLQFRRDAPLTYFHDGLQIGTYYIQRIERVGKASYQFNTVSAIGTFTEVDHYGGIYTSQTVAEVVADICGSTPHYVKTNLQNIKLYGYLPIATRRENLSQVLFAIGATVKVDMNGYLRIEGLWDGVSATIGEDRVFEGGSVESDTPVTRVIVTEHQYIKGTESKTLYEGTTSEGDIITFDAPMHDLVADGFRILESGVNYAKVSSGNGTLTGTAYVHNTREVSKTVNPGDTENVKRVETATLVSLANANAVADRLARYYAAREVIEADTVMDGESPGDVVTVAHPYGGTVQACIESADVALSGILRASTRYLVGYTPPDIGEDEYYNNALVIVQSGEFIIPENTYSIHVVTIGGAQGGMSGYKGEDGQDDGAGNKGGKGGSGGDGGTGGKVFQVVLDVTPGAKFPISIGLGGGGALASEDGSNAGAPGSATTFGNHSSDNGSSYANGFVDIFSGAVYARAGDPGTAGGDGGDGGTEEESGNGGDGQSVLSYFGGKGGENRGAIGSKGQIMAFAGGGAGGGAAMGNNGADGENGRCSFVDDVLGTGPGYLVTGRNGGAGADATATPSKPMARGNGGTGGHGGGGGGGGGKGRAASAWRGDGGTGGFGAGGGAGGDGCVIVYYRVYDPRSSGAAIDREGRECFDKYGRRLVV